MVGGFPTVFGVAHTSILNCRLIALCGAGKGSEQTIQHQKTLLPAIRLPRTLIGVAGRKITNVPPEKLRSSAPDAYRILLKATIDMLRLYLVQPTQAIGRWESDYLSCNHTQLGTFLIAR
jgi:hypothetical protein